MTTILDFEEDISIQTLIALTKNGDEIVIEENGEPLVRITPIENCEEVELRPRTLGLGKGKDYFISEIFDDKKPSRFWSFDK